ncbi:uncharacterized protein N7473_011112 [Penicillium subrubescens]|uniref:Uncharacterized protein n=1 Tax=Penicillium subrubescens TaxID=1316194 RepID=A0A1Q5UIX6_9EURO|nr:uncharacterized protein N7473_011112 [Penicillium subrubescens]KAJ5882678.1 hypothetical protein N7473_011112 [Penicillium subrubescens]OKP12436.1 hypothetical protein PENSUB_1921 [Penicillium subrubescens]
MAYIDTQPLETFIFEGLRQFVGEHAGSRQSVDTASEVVHSLSLALKNTVLFSQDLHPSDFSSQLEDSLDWVKRLKPILKLVFKADG